MKSVNSQFSCAYLQMNLLGDFAGLETWSVMVEFLQNRDWQTIAHGPVTLLSVFV